MIKAGWFGAAQNYRVVTVLLGEQIRLADDLSDRW